MLIAMLKSIKLSKVIIDSTIEKKVKEANYKLRKVVLPKWVN